MAEAIFRRPHWKENGRKSFLGVRFAIIAVGILEVIMGAVLQFPTNQTLGFSNAIAGVAIIGLGFSLLVFDDAGKAMKEDFQKLSAWLEGLLTNRESPIVSRMETLKENIIGEDADSLSSELKAVKSQMKQTEESVNKQPGALGAIKGEISKLSESIAALEKRQIQSIQTEMSSLEKRQSQSLQTEMSSLEKRQVQSLQTEMSSLENRQSQFLQTEMSSLEKRQTESIQTEMSAWEKRQTESIQTEMSSMENRQTQSLQEQLTSMETRQVESIQSELSSLSEEVRKLPTYKELNNLKKEMSTISKRVKKIEAWDG